MKLRIKRDLLVGQYRQDEHCVIQHGHFFDSSSSKNSGQITKHSLHDVTDLKHGVLLTARTEVILGQHCHCHCSINNNTLTGQLCSRSSRRLNTLANGRHIEAIFPRLQVFIHSKVIYNPSLVIIYSTWERLQDPALFLPSIVPTARVAVGIILPLVFISSNLAIRVASLLEGRFCFRWRSILTFSPTCLEIVGRYEISEGDQR